MKKNILAPVALLTVLFASCVKEVDTQEAVAVKPDSVKGTPFSLTASVDPTLKTTYENEKTFSWKSGDKIQMMIVSSTDANVVSTAILETSDNAATATFSGTIPEGYVPGEYAFYPYGTGDSSYSSDLQLQSDGKTVRLWGTMTPDLDNPLGSVPLIGKVSGSNVAFKTATGILKVTLTGIPSDAYWVCLDMPDNNTYALNGNFTWSDDCILRAEKVSGDKWGQKYISFEPVSDQETRTFFFPIPVGEIPEGMTLSVATWNHGKIAVKTTVKSINVTANKIINLGGLEVPEVWNSIGTGKYADYWLQGIQGVVEELWDVTVEQSSRNSGKYRIVNPYAQAVNMTQSSTHSDYLYFTIDDEGGVSFEDYTTGILYSGGQNFMLKYVESSTQNKIVLGNASTPKVIQLAPDYTNADDPSWKYPRNSLPYMIRIVMPDYVNIYSSSISLTGQSSDLSFALAAGSSAKVNIYISKQSYPTYIETNKGSAITPNGISTIYYTNKVNGATATYSGSNLSSKGFSSGPVYVCYYTMDSETSTILTLGTKIMYYLSSADAATLLGTYKFSTLYTLVHYDRKAYYSIADKDDNNMVLAVSTNPAVGNVQMTKLFGFGSDGSYSSYIVTGPMSSAAVSNLTGTFGSGSSAIGVFSGSTLAFHDDDQSPFMTYSGPTNMSASGDWNIYVRSALAGDSSFQFELTSDDSAATLTMSSDDAKGLVLHFDGTNNRNADKCIMWLLGDNSGGVTPLIATKSLE